MEFRAKLAAVNARSPKDPDQPNVVSVKLEPMYVADAAWLLDHLGEYLIVELSQAPPMRTPLEEAIDVANAR